MATKDKNKGFLSALKKAFNGGDVTPPIRSFLRADIVSLLVPACLLYVQASWGSNGDGITSEADSISLSAELPGERLQKYNILETMAKSPTISTALNIHIAHALAPSKKPDKHLSFRQRMVPMPRQ
ncbi:putative portal protein [Escherichia coli]|uniref:Putative portal protein n=1 Tax=Escherichia coli TaxID=562 RepID=A0A2X1LVR9_ECOLX|nr:putative portal protein [Escherichia coli]